MPIPVFPVTVLPSYSLIRIPTFRTSIIEYGNQVEQRISKDLNPRYQFKLKFTNLSIAEGDIINTFFETRKGTFEAFYFSNLEEAYREQTWMPSTVYTLNQVVRPTIVNERSYKCILAGVSNATWEPNWTNIVNGTNTDGAGYYGYSLTWRENTYLVRFVEDTLNIEYFQYNLYNLNEVNLIQVYS